MDVRESKVKIHCPGQRFFSWLQEKECDDRTGREHVKSVCVCVWGEEETEKIQGETK